MKRPNIFFDSHIALTKCFSIVESEFSFILPFQKLKRANHFYVFSFIQPNSLIQRDF